MDPVVGTLDFFLRYDNIFIFSTGPPLIGGLVLF